MAARRGPIAPTLPPGRNAGLTAVEVECGRMRLSTDLDTQRPLVTLVVPAWRVGPGGKHVAGAQDQWQLEAGTNGWGWEEPLPADVLHCATHNQARCTLHGGPVWEVLMKVVRVRERLRLP